MLQNIRVTAFTVSRLLTPPPSSTQMRVNQTPKLVNKKYYTQAQPVIFFLYVGFPSRPFTNHRTAGEWEGTSLTPHYKSHWLHRHREITADSSSLHIACSMCWCMYFFFRTLLLLLDDISWKPSPKEV